MIVSKNMLIPEIKSYPIYISGMDWTELGEFLNILDRCVTCYLVLALVRHGKDDWQIKYGKVA